MVEHHILSKEDVIQPINSSKNRWDNLFEELKKGETVYYSGDIGLLRKIRRRILSAFHYRGRVDKEPIMSIETHLSAINGKLSLVITSVKEVDDE